MSQEAAFAIGVPLEIYAFYRYSENSTSLFHPLALQFQPPTLPVRPVNPNNACHLRITAAAGTKLAVAASGGTVQVVTHSIFPPERGLQSEDLHPPRGVAASDFRPLRNIPYCCLP